VLYQASRPVRITIGLTVRTNTAFMQARGTDALPKFKNRAQTELVHRLLVRDAIQLLGN